MPNPQDLNKIVQNGYFSDKLLKYDNEVLYCCMTHRQRLLEPCTNMTNSYTDACWEKIAMERERVQVALG